MDSLHKTISAKAVIGSVLSRFGVKDANIHMEALEWIGEGIAEIGYGVGLVNKVEAIEINNHNVLKPCDFFQLNFMIYNGEKLLEGMKPSRVSNKRYKGGDDPLFTELVQLINGRNKSLCFANAVGEDSSDNCDCNPVLDETVLERTNVKIKALIEGLARKNYNSCDEYYINKEDCYQVSIEEGTLYMHYKGYPTDKDGYPLVIDEPKYRKALEWLIMENLTFSGYKHPILNNWKDITDMKELYIARARNNHLKNTYEQMDEFVDKWTNLLFSISKSSNWYSNG